MNSRVAGGPAPLQPQGAQDLGKFALEVKNFLALEMSVNELIICLCAVKTVTGNMASVS